MVFLIKKLITFIQQKIKKLVTKPPLDFKPGEHFGKRYQIIERMKKDRLGRLYKAKDTESNEVISLRIFNPEISVNNWSIIVEKYRRKLMLSNNVRAENLSKLYHIDSVGKTKFISMQYSQPKAWRRYKKLIISFSAAFMVFISLGVIYVVTALLPKEPTIDPSIAVLPFKDFSEKKDQEYFCDGMTEAIIEKLTKLQGLKVIGIDSVMRYKNREKDIKEIGKELGVENILEPSIHRQKNRIRINVKLTNAKKGFHIWAERYDRELGSVFEVQDEISKAIARALQVEILPDALQTAKAREPTNVEAWEYYLKGMHFIDRKYSLSAKEEDFEMALRMFEKALAIDPNYALAYWGLGMAYEHHYYCTKSKKDCDLMLKNCKKAYKLNQNLAEANLAMGWAYFYRGDNDQAYQSFKRAVEIDPNKAIVNFHTGSFLGSIGLDCSAIEYYSKSMERDPLNIWNHILLANYSMFIGEFKKAVIYIKKGLEIEPDNFQLNLNYIRYFILMKRYDEAEKALVKLEEIKPGNPQIQACRAWLFAAKGEKDRALVLIKDAVAYSYEATSIYSILGMKNEAIRYIKEGINRGFKDRMVYLYSYPFLINNPCYDSLRDTPLFQEIVKSQKKQYHEKLNKYCKF